jgi:hypothetical protein
LLGFLRIASTTPSPQSNQHVVIGGNNPFANETDAIIRGRLATIIWLGGRNNTFHKANRSLSE